MDKVSKRQVAEQSELLMAFLRSLWIGLFFLAGSSLAQAPASSIWGKSLMPQPFDANPLRPIEIPSWVQDTLGCGYTLSVMQSADRAKAVEHGVTISELGFVDPFYVYYPSRLLSRRSPYVAAGKLQEEIAEYQRLGVRILAVYPPCLQSEVYELHPQWRRIATDTTEIPTVDLKQFPHGGMLCLLGPYGDFFIDVLAEILEQFPVVDAFSFDGLHYGGVCYCQNCRDAYRRDTSKEIPVADMNNPEFRRYQHWADRRMENLVQRMQVRLKSIKPSVALVTWTTNAGRFGHFLSIPRNMPSRMNLLLDAPDQEFWADETNRGATIVPAFSNAYIWATTNHRVAFSEPYILSHGNPYGKDSFPAKEIEYRMLLSATHGALPSIAVSQPPNLQESLYHCMDQLQERKAWLINKRPEKWAAMVMSDNSRNFYGRSSGLVEERYMSHVFGTFRAAIEEHLPITIINDWNLNESDLSEYELLVLPNTACLDMEQANAIREFVRNGGGLVASLDSSLFNEFGDARDNFLLADVFGVDFQGLAVEDSPISDKATAQQIDSNFAISIPANYWEKRKGVFDFKSSGDTWLDQGRMNAYVGNNPVTFKGPAVGVQANSTHRGRTIATITPKSQAGSAALPAVVTNEFGKGKVVYLAGGFDAAYYLYAYPYERLVMKHAMQWVARSRPPVEVQAPHCIHATLNRQTVDGADRLVLQLLNDLNTTAFHALNLDDIPLREETVPIHDIVVKLAPRYSVRQARLQPAGVQLQVTQTEEGTRIEVPRIDLHAIVEIELLKP